MTVPWHPGVIHPVPQVSDHPTRWRHLPGGRKAWRVAGGWWPRGGRRWRVVPRWEAEVASGGGVAAP